MRIIRRESTYYLQHSFRKAGEVITKEKNLGKKIPDDVRNLEQSFLRECRKEAFYDSFDTIREHFRSEWGRLPASVKEKMLREFSINFTYNTNAIEGSTITEEETRDIVEHRIAPHKSLSDVKETESHAKLFFAMLATERSLTQEVLLDWHRTLFIETKPDIAGTVREYQVRVGGYHAPDWQDLKKLLKEFFSFLHETKDVHVVEFAARVHYRFEKIHPFGDGNGRIGRLVMNSLIWHKGFPLLIIEYKRRKSYYQALSKDEDYFVQYFLRRYLAVHKKYLIERK